MKVGADLYEIDTKHYLVLLAYYSTFLDVYQLKHANLSKCNSNNERMGHAYGNTSQIC